jgi:hypothetical protein
MVLYLKELRANFPSSAMKIIGLDIRISLNKLIEGPSGN